MRVIRTLPLIVWAFVLIANAKKDDKDDKDDLCDKVKCERGKRCEVISDPIDGEIAICVVANDCGCMEGHKCVRDGKKTTCVCVEDSCLPRGTLCGGGAFHCSIYEECVDDERCCIGDCKSMFASYVFRRPEPICAEDGVTYESLCFFNRNRCWRNDFKAFVSFLEKDCTPKERTCGPHFCTAEEICTKSHMGYRCCPASCPIPEKPDYLCGDDDHVHLDACHLKRAACIIGHDIQIVDDKLCKKDCNLGKKKVKSGKSVRLTDGCSICQCNNGHWHCNHSACL